MTDTNVLLPSVGVAAATRAVTSDEDERRSPAIAVLGGGCAGLALGVAALEVGVPLEIHEARRADRRDTRSWCAWDDGSALLPEAASTAWARWEVLTDAGRAVSSDPSHPYRLVRAQDYRDAARARLTQSAVHLHEGSRARISRGTDGRPMLRAHGWLLRFDRVLDARGRRSGPPAKGRVLLHQRFLGWWVRATRPVFDPRIATLMDFRRPRPDGGVRFFYVLPVAPDLALVEVTVFTSVRRDEQPFAAELRDYLDWRWSLADDEWAIEDEEAGCIAMTDDVAAASGAIGVAAGVVRPSSGYAFSRIQRHARMVAADLAAGREPRPLRDATRTRLLDAVFLRFLRDDPRLAPAVFLRLFAALPGPLTVRFLTERSGVTDDLRVVLALPKGPFLRAAARTAVERMRAVRR